MMVPDVVAALRRTPMRSYDELAAGSPTAPEQVPGMFAWWQRPGALPGVPGVRHPEASLELLYVGAAPREVGSRGHLRKSLARMHRGPIGTSTFRFHLSAFLWKHREWKPFWTDRAVLSDDDLADLAAWQREHLVVQWVALPDPWAVGHEVVAAMRPPLVPGADSDNGFSATTLIAAREELRSAAGDRRPT